MYDLYVIDASDIKSSFLRNISQQLKKYENITKGKYNEFALTSKQFEMTKKLLTEHKSKHKMINIVQSGKYQLDEYYTQQLINFIDNQPILHSDFLCQYLRYKVGINNDDIDDSWTLDEVEYIVQCLESREKLKLEYGIDLRDYENWSYYQQFKNDNECFENYNLNDTDIFPQIDQQFLENRKNTIEEFETNVLVIPYEKHKQLQLLFQSVGQSLQHESKEMVAAATPDTHQSKTTTATKPRMISLLKPAQMQQMSQTELATLSDKIFTLFF